MNNDYTKYDTNGYHDSHCEGPNCNCDSRRYGYGTEFNGSAVLGVDGFSPPRLTFFDQCNSVARVKCCFLSLSAYRIGFSNMV